MRGIANDEDASFLKSLRHIRRRTPAGEAVDPDLQIRHSHSGTDELDQAPFAHVRGSVRGGLRIELGIADDVDR